MKQHKFTIVIVTRERAETLYWAIKTCLDQDYDNLEIIISDNFSQDNTKEVVKSFTDPRLKYINTGKRVQMSSNYEFALSHVKEGYVGVLGDDDGYFINSISYLNKIINHTKTQGISWSNGNYFWNNYNIDAYRNFISLPVSNSVFYYNGNDRLERFHKREIAHNQLLSIYQNGFVHIDVINKIRTINKGKFILSPIPDVYAALVMSQMIGNYVFSEFPFSLAGTSKNSNSGFTRENTAAFEKFLSENKEIPFHSKMAYCNALQQQIGDAILYAAEFNNQILGAKTAKQVMERIMIEVQYQDQDFYNDAVIAMKETAKMNNIASFGDELIKKYPHIGQPTTIIKPQYSFNASGKLLTLDGTAMGVSNIYEAVKLCTQLSGLHTKDNIEFYENAKFANIVLKGSYYMRRIAEKYLGKAINLQ